MMCLARRCCLAALSLALLVPGLSAASDAPHDVWVVKEVSATRFSDADTATLALKPGEKVQVIAEAGELVRVQKGFDFGWVPVAAVTEQEPVSADVKLDLGGPPSFR